MKKLYITLCIVFLTIPLFSQITITAETHSFSTDLSISMRQSVNVLNFDIGNEGADQVWDFSVYTGGLVEIDYAEPSAGQNSEMFPDANLVELGGGLETYMSANDNALEILGVIAPSQFQLIFSDLRTFVPFPFTYQDVVNDTFIAQGENFNSGQEFDREGEVEITGDGYGTLILPFDTLDNVLRIRATSTYTDVVNGTPSSTINDSLYLYFHESYSFPIAVAAVIYSDGAQLQNQITYATENTLSTSVGEIENHVLSVFPNPASEKIQLNWSGPKAEVSIVDLNGKLVSRTEMSGRSETVDVGHLQSGIYFVKVVANNQVVTKKLVIE